ncbi:S-layer homology domain-containing protein [Paenibacillus sp. FSL H3-0469]|uniref:S-layer homology domain-containing protein n=1 Tax=Paenibacillus sp. FSL H3-0469 TaxID=2954506 RepID=UPI0031012C81
MVSNNMNLRKIGIMFLIFTLVFTGMGLSFGTSVSYADASDIYVASNGNDSTGDGTEDKPYATLPKANQEVVSGGTIYVMDDITLSPVQPGKFLELKGGKQITITTDPNASQTAVIKRGGSGTLLDLLDGHLTLKNIIIDGMGTSSAGRIVNVYGASSLTIEDGANLRNNNIYNLPASAIYVSDPASTVKMTGGEISGNKYAGTATSAILMSNGEFTMSGGRITGNTGGGVEVTAGKFILSGIGQITANLIASGKGQNVNLKSSNLLYLNGDFTGKAGITVQTGMTEGSKFGEAISRDLKGIENLIADNTPSIFAAYGEGNALVWKKAPAPGGVGVGNGLISWVDVGKSAKPVSGRVTELQDLAINEIWDRNETDRIIPYSANAVNYNPAIQVTSSTTYFKKASLGTTQDTEREVFSVQASSNFAGFPWDLGGKYAATSAYGNGSGNLIRTYFGSDSSKDIDVTGFDLKKTRVMNIWSAADSGNPNQDQWSFSLDGKQLNPINGAGDQHKVNFTLAAGSKVYIGAGHYSRFNGSISEVIVFNKKLSETERHKVNSYLALKYGLTLKNASGQLIDYVTSDHAAGQTSTMWTAANNQGYGTRITGIGRDDKGALNQKQSKSQDNGANLAISLGAMVANSNEENNEEIANDRSFFVFSDNGAGTEFISPIDKDNESLKHTARIYKVEKTNWADKVSASGPPVQVTFQVDKVETAEQWPLYLVVSADDQFDHQDKFYELVDGKVTLSSEDLNNGSYFTIAAPAPKLISAVLDQATTDSKQIVFTFDQNVVLTDSTGFFVEMDGTEVPMGQVTIKVDPVDTTKLIVTLPSGTDIAGKTVTVSYSGKGNLKGSNGVPVDAFDKDIIKLAKPNAQLNKDMLSWGPVDHADNYEVTVKLSDGTSITKDVYGAELDLSTLGLEPGSYEVTVNAKSDNDAYVDSEPSDSVTYTVTKVDKTALQGKVTEAGALDKKEYTAESWSKLELELAEANTVLNNPEATQEQVDAAVTKLTDAIGQLEKVKVDKTVLQGKVTEAGALNEKEYTAESWSKLELELAEANTVLNDPTATQEQVDAAVTKLTDAIGQLEKIKVDKTALEAKVSEAGALDKKEYTAESWSKLELELTEANTMLNNPEATQEQVDRALAELQKALDDLIVTSGELQEINLVGLTNEGSQAIQLTPEFDPNQNKNYKGTVTNNVYGISLNPVAKYPDDTQVKITVNNVEYASDKWNKLPLNEGENEIRVGVFNTAGELINEYIYIIVREKAPGNGGNNGGGSDGSGSNSGTYNPITPPTPPATENTNIVTTVNGADQSFATGTVTPNGDQAMVTIDPDKLASFIADGKGHKLGIRVPGNGNVEVQGLTLEDLKKIADTGSSLDVEDVLAIYPVPAGQLDVNAISRQFGNAPISNIAVNIKIKRSADDVTNLAREKATLTGYELLVHPVDLDLSFMHDGKTDRAGLLKGYAPKSIALPEGIDPNRITTGVIVNPDGTVFHVPTVVTKINNRYFALINDLRSSGTYSVIWNPQDFDDVRNHWSKADVNNIAARLSLKGNGDNTFSPNRSVSRSEFAEIVVTGLGLMRQNVTQADFSDVPASAWYKDSVAIANEFDIVRGYGDGNFKGNQQITREQGFAMIARAYRLIQSEDVPSQEQIASTLASYTDGTNVAAWAQGDVAQLILAGIIQGNGPQSLNPKAPMARAEVTALIARMLKVTDLIDK